MNLLNKPCVNHINSIRSDNRVSNLEWCTWSENVKHSYDFGNQCVKGERNPSSKVTELQVLEIRSLYNKVREDRTSGVKTMTKNDIARIYNISIHIVKSIVEERTWKHLL